MAGNPAFDSERHIRSFMTWLLLFHYYYYYNSSSDSYTENVIDNKAHQEKRYVKFTSDSFELYYVPFSMIELQTALHEAHDSAASSDSIHYQMLKCCPEIA